MIAAVNYYWRMLMTGACFLLFSTGGAVGSFTVFPAVRLMPGGPGERERRVRWMICKFFGLMVALLRITGVMRLETQGLERLQRARGVLVLANHPSLLDVVVLLSAMPRATCVVKDEWWANPFIAGVVSAAGYIRNSEAEQVLEDCDRARAALVENVSPELAAVDVRNALHAVTEVIALESDDAVLDSLFAQFCIGK